MSNSFLQHFVPPVRDEARAHLTLEARDHRSEALPVITNEIHQDVHTQGLEEKKEKQRIDAGMQQVVEEHCRVIVPEEPQEAHHGSRETVELVLEGALDRFPPLGPSPPRALPLTS